MDDAYTAAYLELYRHHWWWRVREEILLRRISSLLDPADLPARILDVGCGAGLFFDALERFGHVEGIETDETAVAQAGKWQARIHVRPLDNDFVPAQPYDLILMLDVLEHLDEPESLLRHARRLLAPSGQLLVTVPAFNWLWTQHDEVNHHKRRYTVGGLRRLVTGAGFAPVASAYLFPSLIIPKALVRIKETLARSTPHVPTIPPEPINTLAITVLRIEQAVAWWLPFGSSAMLVAQRDDAAT